MFAIYHLYHSGVAIEYKEDLFIFDYFNDQAEDIKNSLSSGVICRKVLKEYKNIYVFVSHQHQDHYNPVIFQWKVFNPNTYYILSDDIKPGNQDNVFFVEKDDSFILNNLKVSVYGSTDLGVSYLVELDGKSVFHAGDLNWWCWDSFSKEQLKEEEKGFKEEVENLKEKKIDIAFVPVDPRLGRNYYLAGEYFIETIKPSLFIPIHFADEYSITEKFAIRFFNRNTKVAIIRKRGQKIIYE